MLTVYKKSKLFLYYDELRKMYDLNIKVSINYGIYNKYPYIFSKLFKVEDIIIDKFALLSDLYVDHIVFIDQVCENRNLNLDYIIEKYLLGNELVIELSSIFPKESIFWDKYRQLYNEYFQALMIEQKIKSGKYKYKNKEEYFKVCAGKSALSKMFVYAMALLSDNLKIYTEIDEMLEYLDIYVQILDDFKDIKQDLADRQFSYYLYLAYDKNQNANTDEIIGYFLKNNLYEQVKDMKLMINKTKEIFEKYANVISEFKTIIDDQEKTLELIESRMNINVCK